MKVFFSVFLINLFSFNLYGDEVEVVKTSGSHASQHQAPPVWINFLLFGGMLFFAWFFIIRPQSKKQKLHRDFLQQLKKGQRVITQGGIIGEIDKIDDRMVVLNLSENNKVSFLKDAILAEDVNQNVGVNDVKPKQ